MPDSVPHDGHPFIERPLSKSQARQKRKEDKQAKQPGSAPLVAKSASQETYLGHLKAGRDVFAVGGAGTGKTYLAARIAARAIVDGRAEKIIVCRPAVTKSKHQLGFRPGNTEMKMIEWLIPIVEGIRTEVSGATLDKWKAAGQFEIVPFETMRGRTFANAVVILDEAQNCDFGDLKMFLTRAGEDGQIIVTGDTDQLDIHNSGLADVIDMVLRFGVPMEVVQFADHECVRSPLARAFVIAFKKYAEDKERAAKAAQARLRVIENDTMSPDADTFLDGGPAFLNNGINQRRAA